MSPAQTISEIIRQWSQVFMQRYAHDFKHFMHENDLSFSQFNVLMCLFHGRNFGVSGIGEEMGVTRAAASQAVERLVQLDLIERTEDPNDRRSKRLSLTKKGRSLMADGIKGCSQWIEGLAEALTPEQQQIITPALTILTEKARMSNDWLSG